MARDNVIISSFKEIDIRTETMSAVITVYYDTPGYQGKYVANLCDRNIPTKYIVVKDTLREVRNAIPYGLNKMNPLESDSGNLIERYI